MANRRWLLPEAIEDVLPQEAAHIEAMRRTILDEFSSHGFDLVSPPLLEYVESLVGERGQDLDVRTFKLVDQLSGRSMAIRADITPQVARIDAHQLNRHGVTRLCYCGSVLHTLPAGFNATREPMQIGAEIYGHAGLEADIECIRLLAESLKRCAVVATRIDLGHVAVFRAMVREASLDETVEKELFESLQGKDVPAVRELVAGVSEPLRSALLALPELYGDRTVLDEADRMLPDLPAVSAAINDLRRLAGALGDLPLSFDLADLRGYRYHTGVAFSAYCEGSPGAVALGGRYDDFGRIYGRGRPGTGFSMDLRALARLAPPAPTRGAIVAPWPEDDALHAEAQRLRSLGERVVLALPGHEGRWREAGCDRKLVRNGDNWTIEILKED